MTNRFSLADIDRRKAIVRDVLGPIAQAKRDSTIATFYKRVMPSDQGRIHTSLAPDTASGRLSSSESALFRHCSSNLQNQPKKIARLDPLYHVRDLFIPTKGMVLVAGDYAGAEAVLVAAYMQDWPFYDKLLLGLDVHAEHGRDAYGADYDDPEKTELLRQIVKSVTYACVPMDTQILTMGGWKTVEELSVGEPVIGFDDRTEQLVPDRVTAINRYQSAPLFQYSINGFTVVCTNDHRWLGRFGHDPSRPRAYRVSPASLRTEPIRPGRAGFNLVVSAPYTGGNGLARAPGLSCAVTVQDVLAMTPIERRAFLLGVASGEGSQTDSGVAICQSKKKYFEPYLLAVFLEGLCPRVREKKSSPNCFDIYGAKPTVGCTNMRMQPIKDAPVWCPTTATGYWVMRQGDQIALTGNSFYYASVPILQRTVNKDVEHLNLYLSQAQVAAVRAVILQRHPIERWWEETRRLLERQAGVLRNCFGYSRTFRAPDPHKRLKEALSFFPQSTVAWLMNDALPLLYDQLDRPGECELLLQIHDEALFQCRPESVTHLIQLATPILQREFIIHDHPVHIPVEWSTGPDWGHLKKMKVA